MCGINGIFGLENLSDPTAVIQKMNNALQHRGPDAEGVFMDDRVVLGHRRLSIIDLSSDGNQPFYSPEKDVVLIINGEIYNYLELKAELQDYPFRTHSDTEVVMAAYLKWGISFLHKVNGMFALAIWDTRSGELLIARDRIGIKPLYIARQGQQVLFSSEVRALLNSGLIDKKLDHDGLIDYLRYGTVHAPRTMVKDVEMVLPGHYLTITDNEIKSVNYWSLGTHVNGAASYADKNQAQKQIRELLTRSVELRMRADVSFGAFLSGGIDSSAVVALMSEVSDRPVSTFSVTFDEQEFNEGPFAERVARKFNTQHTEIRLKLDDFLQQVPLALDAMDHPSADGPNTYVVSGVTKNSGITMALSGLGGDELFAGYDIFKRMYSLRDKKWLASFPPVIRKMLGSGLTLLKPDMGSRKVAEVLRQDYLDFEYVYPINRLLLLDNDIIKLVQRKGLPENSVHQLLKNGIAHGNPGFDLPLLSKVSYAEMHSYMQNTLLRDTDQMSMAHALEVRVPFLDHKLVEYVAGLGDSLKYPHTPKQLLTESLGDLIDPEIIHRPKMGFTLPWAVWMKSDLKSLCEHHLNQLSARPYFKSQAILDLWTAFQQDKISWS
ncbi:MAG: asparagine synthase (glutamine-hydrolyzing), partial [Flavobacteriales bacterium]|nr:asparagine synthase (glutamine-hydrolyzing) [Flavobacteriales bacterium]